MHYLWLVLHVSASFFHHENLIVTKFKALSYKLRFKLKPQKAVSVLEQFQLQHQDHEFLKVGTPYRLSVVCTVLDRFSC